MFEEVKKLLEEVTGVGDIKPESALVADLGLTSFDMMSLIIEFEEHFNIEISDKDIRKLITVADVAAYIEKKVWKLIFGWNYVINHVLATVQYINPVFGVYAFHISHKNTTKGYSSPDIKTNSGCLWLFVWNTTEDFRYYGKNYLFKASWKIFK